MLRFMNLQNFEGGNKKVPAFLSSPLSSPQNLKHVTYVRSLKMP